MSQQHPVEVYGKQIPWEIPVQLCVKDFLGTGGCAFDVGANIGGLSIAMSRLAGPTGRVHAFEANPMLVARLRRQLSENGVGNVTVVARAVWSKTGERLPFYCDPSYYASASSLLYRPDASNEVVVETVSLDDYTVATGSIPDVIKIDVEGAEVHVLTGASRLIAEHAPVIVCEYYASVAPPDDPAEFLRSRGYTLYDANLYCEVDRAFYLSRFPSPPLTNLLAIPSSRLKASRYASLALTGAGAAVGSANPLRSEVIPLREPGRYIAKIEFDGPDGKIAALKVTSDLGETLAYVQAPIPQLKQHSCSHLVFELDRPARIRCEVEPGEPGSFILREAQVLRVSMDAAARGRR